MGLGSKMQHCIDLVLSENVVDQVGGANVTLDKREVFVVLDLLEVVNCCAIVQFIQTHHLVLGVLRHEFQHHVGSTENRNTHTHTHKKKHTQKKANEPSNGTKEDNDENKQSLDELT